MMRLCAVMQLFISSCSALSKSSAPSSLSANTLSDSATALLSMMFAHAIELEEPTMRNSNLLPVKAKGEVRLRSVVSLKKRGRVGTPSYIGAFSAALYGASCSMDSSTAVSSSPRKIDTTAGGASFAPRRWSFPAVATLMRSRS